MQGLTLVSEDSGVHRLRSAPPATASAGRLDGVAGYPTTHRVQIGETAVQVAERRPERRRGERRTQQRRGQQLAIAFDTRGRHDRRDCQDRRRAPRETDTTAAQVTGIDVFA